MDDMMRYNPAMLADYTSTLMTFSATLDSLGQEALQKLAGIHEFFDTQHGSVAYQQAQQLIIDGINDGKEVIARHSGAVETSGADFVAYDASAGNSFMSI
ncbi:hypothetical protein [uncultured Mycobacterium sp.]|uniref:hypothetical protein n=1 Tax=uncultured Mycobacterium sp. TaxID=171292 RepID=UPI0035CA5821